MKGLSSSAFSSSTTARVIRAMLAMPRLPAVTATVWPGFTLSRRWRGRIISRIAEGISRRLGPSNRCLTRRIRGKTITNLLSPGEGGWLPDVKGLGKSPGHAPANLRHGDRTAEDGGHRGHD